MKKNSHPERTCLACRKKADKAEFFKLVKELDEEIFDEKQKLNGRSRYICKNIDCLVEASKNKRITISSELLYILSKKLKKKSTDLTSTLNVLERSSKLCFGYEMTKESLLKKKVSFLIIAKDMNEKNKKDIEDIAEQNSVKKLIYGDSAELGEIFSKEKVGVIGITDKKTAIGFAKKLGGEQIDS